MRRHISARRALLTSSVAMLLTVATGSSSTAAATPSPILISQIPLTVAMPAHPQVLLAVGNSQSMDGDLSGAIMTGSGLTGLTALQNSSSPVNYVVPASFTPPLNAGSGGSAPYTVLSGDGKQRDNSASRLNVAKAGITAILQSFLPVADFALMDYQTSNEVAWTTWVYYMSPPGSGFTFANTAGPNQVVNPCFGVDITAGGAVARDCARLNSYYRGQSITTQQYMNVGWVGTDSTVNNPETSDNPAINDVLYAGGGIDPLCVTYNTPAGPPSPPTPFPPNYSLASYESGGILEFYGATVNSCAPETGPTNAGFVPYSPEVMYAQRGFGFYTFGETADDGKLLVPMTSAGAAPTTASMNTAMAAFTPLLAAETNVAGTGEIQAEATQSPIAGLLRGARRYLQTNPPSSNGCTATRYIVLVTDGLPTMDLSGHNWPPLGSVSGNNYGVTASFNADGSLNSTNDQALADVISQVTRAQGAGIKTYVIGLGAGVDPTVNPQAAATLKAMAVAGGTSNYFAANSPADLTSDLQVILAQILAATQTTSTAAVNSSRANTNSVDYQSQFTTSDTHQDWTGNLWAFPIDPSSGQPTTPANWSAQAALDGQSASSRLIATWDPIAGKAIPFEWTSGTSTSGISSSTALGTALTSNPADTNGQHALQYLRGDRSLEQSNGGPYRTRTHVLADIVDSAPLYVGAPSRQYLMSSYFTFESDHATRPPVVYAGANDGMLHAFDAGTGTERFAYIPHGVYNNLIKLTSLYYNEQHQFFVDGSPQANDVQFSDASWHTLLVGGENAGGSSVYALDVTDPGAITDETTLASDVLWEFTDGNMGLSYSEPAISRTNAGYLVFFGNGYNSPTQTPFLYALDPQTGAVTAKIDLCSKVPAACDSSKANGLSSVTVANSQGALANPADVLYAGDLQGNLWRVDISNSTPANWTVKVLFQARDASGNAQPITTKPLTTMNPRYPRLAGTMVFFGTGQMLGIPDLGSTQVQSLYGIYDSGNSTTILTRDNLVQQVFSLGSVTVGTTTVSVPEVTDNGVSIPTKAGWYDDLTLLSGERIVTDSALVSGVLVVTSNQPSPNTCTAGDASVLYEVNYATGGKFSTGQLNLGSGNTLYNTAGMFLGDYFAAGPRILSGNFGTSADGPISLVKQINLSNGTTLAIKNRGPGQARSAWREIR